MDPQKTLPEATIHGVDKRRSERVMLRVPVLLSVTANEGIVTEEATYTEVVNAHGGLLSLEMDVSAGQQFVLTNSKTGISRECTVVRTQQSPARRGLVVAFQFETPCPDFWPIVFPPKDWQALESQVTAQEK